MAREDHLGLIRAHVIGDVAAANAIDERIPGEERMELFGLLTAFFMVLLGLRLGEHATREEIAAFLAEVRDEYAHVDPPVKLAAIEAAVRGVYGEEHLMGAVPVFDLIEAQFLVISKLALQAADVLPNLDHYLAEAGKLAERWGQEED